MSSTRNILKFLRFGTGKRRGFSKNLASSMLLHSRAFGTASFFLNGNIIIKDAKGRVKDLYLAKRDKYKRTSSGKISIAEAVNESFTGYPELDSFEDIHPLHQTLRFKRSVARLKEKATEVCDIYPTMPKPGIRSKIDEDILLIEIPLLSSHGKSRHF